MSRMFASCALVLALLSPAFAQTVPDRMLAGLVWRNIGPFRGGRVSAVTGVIGQPGTFYMGLPMGGVWKTTSAGTTWFPIFDSVKEVSSVGAIEVAPSDPNVVYVGMGDMTAGGSIARGNGVYKSTDAGKTWRHLGLDGTQHIPYILVDPHDPNLVMVAALGDNHEKSDKRGVFRSMDGGESWAKTLYVDDETGVERIAWADDHPNVMLATTMRYYTAPGARGGGFGGGANARIYKSEDEGLTWKELKGGGLPGLAGRTCVAIANGTKSQRMFLVGNFGLYRSDDGGATWRQMDAKDTRVRNGQGGYNCGVYVDPKNPDTVYVVNTCSYISRDGGTSFTGFKGAPGGDDPQQMWIDPTDGKRIFLGMDQGATISLDGGENWSLWYNQPSDQLYHISVDNQFPYRVYGTEQDSGSIMTASRGNYGEITPMDWSPHPGYEFGSIVADPLNPQVSYAGGEASGIVRVTSPSGQWINVSPNLDSSLALRKVTNQPLIFSPTNPHELLTGFQYVMATTDGGRHWRKLSPDLTRSKGEAPEPAPAQANRRPRAGARGGRPAAAPAAPAAAPPKAAPAANGGGQEPFEEDEEEEEEGESQRPGFGGAIESISVSSVDGGVIWAGTSNGHIQVTQDHGASWEDVTIPDLPNGARADISAIDASHHAAGTAYVAVDCHNVGDYKPYLYRTRDFGKTWTPIVNGLPDEQTSGSFARVIRADTVRDGLLFAGTESSVYVSFDDGDDWQPLTLNLPNTSYRDLVIKDNDLVAGTYGRGVWILDDISPLRQVSAAMTSEPAHLFKPGDAYRVRRNVNDDTPFPPEVPHAPNPPDGAIIYYSLAAQPMGEITLDVTDSAGKLVRRMSSAPIPPLAEPPPPIPDFWVAKPRPLPTSVGLDRVNWDLRRDPPPAFSHSYEISANPGGTPPSPEGPLVLPGTYTLTLTVDGKSCKQTVTVKNDPRSPASLADLRAQHALQMKAYDCAREAWEGYHQVAAVRDQIAALLKSKPSADVEKAATALQEKLTAVQGSAGFGGRFFGGGGFGRAGGSPAQPTFSQIQGAAIRHLKSFDTGDMAPTESARKAILATCAEMNATEKTWAALRTKDVPAFNTLLARNNLRPVTVAAWSATQPSRVAGK